MIPEFYVFSVLAFDFLAFFKPFIEESEYFLSLSECMRHGVCSCSICGALRKDLFDVRARLLNLSDFLNELCSYILCFVLLLII